MLDAIILGIFKSLFIAIPFTILILLKFVFRKKAKAFSYGKFNYTNMDLNTLKNLLETKLILNEQNNLGITAMMLAAAQTENLTIVKTMVDSGADTSICDKDERNSFVYACMFNSNLEIVKYLRSYYGNIDQVDKYDNSVLLLAAAYNENPAIIGYLVEEGADINIQNQNGISPLINAAISNTNPLVLLKLLDLGADKSVKDKEGNKAIYYAKQNSSLKNTDLIKLLKH